ncbi:acyltransferase [Novosphingobium resinovorum]|uniref:acyltransferase family protein n=1 Tax=Novosphingobium resinovorum TaxID=158500 RepID=UPI002ED44D6F|nr:acyltransferase [Novosphingobium resinovorum]
MASKRLDYIDALRGLAITGVIITHTASLAGVKGPVRNLTNLAGNGVLLFFVVSAFTIFLTFHRAAQSEQRPVRNFFIKRVMRIAPIYWLGMILYTVVYGLGSRGWRPGPEIWHYPFHATFTNLLVPGVASSVVPGGWSISCEMLFYVTVPLWFLLIKSTRAAAIFTLICITVLPLMVLGMQHLFAPMLASVPADEVKEYWYRSFPSQLGSFSFGILLYFLIRDGKGRFLQNKSINLAVILLAAAIMLVTHMKPALLPRQYWFTASCMLIAWALSHHSWSGVVNKLTIFMGKISYSGYILHFLVIDKLFKVLPAQSQPLATFITLFSVGMAVTIPLAYLSFKFIETPLAQQAKGWIKQLESKSSTHGDLEDDALAGELRTTQG